MVERLRGPRAIVGIRARTVAVAQAAWEVEWRRYYAGLRRRFMSHLRGQQGRKAARMFHVKQDELDQIDWNDINEAVAQYDWEAEIARKRAILEQQYLAMTQTVWEDVVGSQVGRSLAFDLNARGVDRVLGEVGTRITGMTQTDQASIARAVGVFIERNSNADELEAGLDRLLRSWGESGGRAHIIALTESGNAYNLAAIAGYEETGLVERVRVFDGPDCGWLEHDDPDRASGSTRTLAEARKHPLAHPHCQRAFAPVVLTDEPDEEAPEVFDGDSEQAYDEYIKRNFASTTEYEARLSEEQLNSIRSYTRGGYFEINSKLRNNYDWSVLVRHGADADEIAERIGHIRSAMEPLREGVVVRRSVEEAAFGGIRIHDAEGVRNLVGSTYRDPGFLSTSMNRLPVSGRAIEMDITVPKGTPSFPAYRLSGYKYEKELLLQDGTTMVVTSAETVGDVLRVALTVVPSPAP